jgi:hypothetical protein
MRLPSTLLLLLVLSIAGGAAGCSTAKTSLTTPQPAATPTQGKSTEAFDASNYSVLATDPKAHQDAQVDIVGQVFGEVSTGAGGIAFQMFADPKNSEWNTVVYYSGQASIKSDDYVRVSGVVAGEMEGQNAFGATVSAAKIEATSVEVVDATEAGTPPTRIVELKSKSSQHGVTVRLTRIEFTPEETRVYITVTNSSHAKANFYDFNAKAVQGSKQYDAEYAGEGYPEVQSEILPGVTSKGVVIFKPMDASKRVKLRFEVGSDNYTLDFKPYQFTVGP